MSSLPITFWGKLIYYFLPYRKKVIRNNIKQVFSNFDEPWQKNLAQAFYSHLLSSLKEILFMRFMSIEKIKSQVEVRGIDYIKEVAAQNRGILILTGHFGNWEFAPIGGILNFDSFEGHFHFIRRSLTIKWLEKVLFRRYFKAGLRVIPQKNSLHQVCDVLAQNHAVVFVLDQHASIVNRDGVAAEFFGKKAGTYRSLATISRYTGVPVIPAASRRVAKNHHILEFFPPIAYEEHQSTKDSIYYNTLAYNKALEKIILSNPAQWIWLHKRWKI